MSSELETHDEIYFYSHRSGKYACFSNFYPATFNENGVIFNCSEQYFMYQKCLLFDPENKELLAKILASTDPAKIKNFGRQVKNFNEHIWKNSRESAMYSAVTLKFSQNSKLKKILLDSGNKMLYEASQQDKIWGIGFYAGDALSNRHKFGMNLLGKCLARVRNDLSK